jgi:hypothetical protein
MPPRKERSPDRSPDRPPSSACHHTRTTATPPSARDDRISPDRHDRLHEDDPGVRRRSLRERDASGLDRRTRQRPPLGDRAGRGCRALDHRGRSVCPRVASASIDRGRARRPRRTRSHPSSAQRVAGEKHRATSLFSQLTLARTRWDSRDGAYGRARSSRSRASGAISAGEADHHATDRGRDGAGAVAYRSPGGAGRRV